MLAAKIILAVGMALLLVVGAWSASHGEADVHASLCLAPGATAGDIESAGGHEHTAAASPAPDDFPVSGLGFAALWLLVLLLLIVRATRRGDGILLPRRALAPAPPRAGPGRRPSALTLTELSLSRT